MTWVVVGAAMLLLILVAAVYNQLIGRRNRVLNVFASLDALLKKRYDLIPNLVAAVRGYMTHERGTLERLTELRGEAVARALNPGQTLALNSQVGGLVIGLRAAFERYPDLKASANFLQLQAALNEVEEQISAGRRAYNASVMTYNNGLEMFPSSLVARLFGFTPAVFFEAAEAERARPDAGTAGSAP